MHGHVTPEAARQMALLLSIMVIGLPFFSVVNLTVRAFYAVKDTRTPVRVALVDFLINITVSLLLIRWLGVIGIVLASTTSIIAQTFLLGRALVRRLPAMHFAPLLPSLVKVLGATAVMAAVVWGGWHALVGTKGADAVAVVGLIPLGIGAYGVVLWMARIEGRKEIEAMLARLPLVGRLFRPAL
jgi:putative peptidoglycan lipid II flippase